MKKLLVLAVAAAAISSGANAAWQTGAGATPSGELMLTVWNPETETAFSQDLGVFAGEAISDGLALGSTFTLSTTGLNHVLTGGSTDQLQWNIVGANYGLDYGVAGYGWYMTASAGSSATLSGPAAFSPGHNALKGVISDYNTFLGFPSSSADANPVVLTSGDKAHAGEGNNFGDRMDNLVATFGVAGTAGGDAESLAALALGFDATGANSNRFSAGAWTLNSTAGTLVYAATSEVPVPAAAWLFGSALVGLVGVGRKRKVFAK